MVSECHTDPEKSVWGCDGVASVRADSLYANGILSSFPFVGALAAMDKATQRGRKWAHCRSEGRREAGTLKCRRSLRASNLREESFYDTTAAQQCCQCHG